MAQRLLSLLVKRLRVPPADMAVTPLVWISTGVICKLFVFVPRSPLFSPMPQRLPSLLRNKLWSVPAEMALTPLATICSGVV